MSLGPGDVSCARVCTCIALVVDQTPSGEVSWVECVSIVVQCMPCAHACQGWCVIPRRVISQRQKQRMTEKKAKTATPNLRETPEQRQQIEHEDAIEYAGKDGKRVGADPLNSAFLDATCTLSSPRRTSQYVASARTWRGCSELHGL